MIDLRQETPLTLKAARLLPELQRNGKRLDLSTIYRWTQNGCTRAGRTIRLESVMQGGTRVTTRQAVARFFAALNGEQVRDIDHEQQHDQAERELADAGI